MSITIHHYISFHYLMSYPEILLALTKSLMVLKHFLNLIVIINHHNVWSNFSVVKKSRAASCEMFFFKMGHISVNLVYSNIIVILIIIIVINNSYDILWFFKKLSGSESIIISHQHYFLFWYDENNMRIHGASSTS